MATVIDEIRIVRCPTCDSKIQENNLAKLGLTREELSILKRHRDNETFGKVLQLVDLTMKRFNPEKMATEAENKPKLLQKTVACGLCAGRDESR